MTMTNMNVFECSWMYLNAIEHFASQFLRERKKKAEHLCGVRRGSQGGGG